MHILDFVNSLKITCAMVCAIMIASKTGINFPHTAGVIVLVSMLDTKRHSFKIAAKRLAAAVIALFFSWLVFSTAGFTLPGLSVFLISFILLCLLVRARVAIVLNVVLVVHIFSLQKLDFNTFLNEFMLMLLGVATAFVFNFNTVNRESRLIELKERTLEKISHVFSVLSLCLINEKTTDDLSQAIENLSSAAMDSKAEAYDSLNSFYFQADRYYVEFFSLASRQVHIMRHIEKLMRHEFYIKQEVKLLKEFTDFFVICDHSAEHCDFKESELKKIREQFRGNPLPKTVKEFENRSALNQYLYALEEVIILNRDFFEKYPDLKSGSPE